MQFPVPQFTDVEDKIIGPLTIKQFGIIFGAGMLIFLAYSASKSLIVAGVFIVLIGIPALGIAFTKINGRPIYADFPSLIKFVTSPKILVFHKEATHLSRQAKIKDVEMKTQIEPVKKTTENTQTRLREINRLLQAK